MIDPTIITYTLVGFCMFLTGVIFWNFIPQKKSEKRISAIDPHVLIEWGNIPAKVVKYDEAAGNIFFWLSNGETRTYDKSGINIVQDPTRSDRTTYYFTNPPITQQATESEQNSSVQLIGHAIMSGKHLQEMPKPAVESDMSMLKFKYDKAVEETDRITQRQMQNAILLNRGLNISGIDISKKQ